MVKVNLKEWVRANCAYVALWILMGFVALGLVIHELGIYTLAVIVPFLPYFIVALVRTAQEAKK